MGGTYHVVCHECTEERVVDAREPARAVRDEHAEKTGHRVSCMEIEATMSEA